jgi:hypothetical protein
MARKLLSGQGVSGLQYSDAPFIGSSPRAMFASIHLKTLTA